MLTEINNDDGSLNILDVKKNYVLFARSSLLVPSHLLIGKFDAASSDIDNLNLHPCTTPLEIPEAETLMCDITEYIHDNNDSTSE